MAIKIIDLEQFEDMSLQEMKKEIVVMNTSNHKNIVDELISFISGNQLYIVMELLGAGSCLSIVKHYSSTHTKHYSSPHNTQYSSTHDKQHSSVHDK